ncbi:MAG: insulinase family protein [Sandaracinaceae bacterium]|nr:insulinase family protein [Sandaracinaceae bacterium]
MSRPAIARTLLASTLLAPLAISCGGSRPAPAEYPPLSAQTETPTPEVHTIVAPAREPLRAAPRLLEQRSSSSIVTLRIVFDAGSSDDPVGREGITRLATQLAVEGGAGELTYAQLEERLYPMAAVLDYQVGRDQTVILGRVHRDRLDDFYALFRDVLLRPRMTSEDFERIRAQQASALTLDLRGNDDEAFGKEVLQSMLYEGHPYGHPELGTEAALSRLGIDDVRAQRSRVLCAGRATVGLAGGYPDGFAQRVARDVAELTSDACVGREVLRGPATHESRIVIVDKPEASSVAVSMGVPIDVTREDDDYPAIVLATAWLGQHRQFVGELMHEIREVRGMNYGDYAYPEHFSQEGWGAFPRPNVARRQQYFSIWLRPLRPEQAHFGVRLAIHYLRRFVEVGITQADLDRIRGYLDGYYGLFLQTESRRLGYAIDDAFYGADPAWIERLRARWRTLTVDEVNAAIRRHIDPSRLQIAMIAPGAQALADALGSERDSPMTYAEGRTLPDEVLAVDRSVQSLRIGVPRERITIVPVAQVFAR